LGIDLLGRDWSWDQGQLLLRMCGCLCCPRCKPHFCRWGRLHLSGGLRCRIRSWLFLSSLLGLLGGLRSQNRINLKHKHSNIQVLKLHHFEFFNTTTPTNTAIKTTMTKTDEILSAPIFFSLARRVFRLSGLACHYHCGRTGSYIQV